MKIADYIVIRYFSIPSGILAFCARIMLNITNHDSTETNKNKTKK